MIAEALAMWTRCSPSPLPRSFPEPWERGFRRHRRSAWVVPLLLGLVVSSPVHAGDWPQILGPQRNGVAENESLIDAFPKGGPPTAWRRDVGSGFAGVSVAGGTCVLFHRVNDNERVEAMDAKTGRVLWTTDFPATYVPSFNDDDGPLCAPVVHEGTVYLFGAMANLHAVDLKTGAKRWSRDAFKDYNTSRGGGEPPEGFFGHGSSPLVVGKQVVVNVGGEKNSGLVAFDAATGKTLWTATSERASYSSPVVATVDGTPHLIAVTRLKCVSLDPANGNVRWELPFGQRGPTVNGATPTLIDGHVFLTASYGIGAVFAKIGKSSVDVVWKSDDVCSSQYSTCVEDGGALFGFHGRQDVGVASLVCFDPRTRKVHWLKEGFGYGSLIKADGKLLVLTNRGDLALLKPDLEKHIELSRATILDIAVRTPPSLPALSNGLFYVRHQRTLKCVDLSKAASR